MTHSRTTRVSPVSPYLPASQEGTHPTHILTKGYLPKYFCVSLSLFIVALVSANMNPDSSVLDNADSIYPCGKCHTPVTFGHKGLQCDTCSHWFHAPCQRVGDHQYDYLAESSCSWHCTRCNSQNYSTKSTQNLSSFDTGNKYSLLDTSTNFEPSVTSTPSKPKQQAHSLKTTRSSHSAQYRRHQTYSDALKNSFFPRTIPHWNSLPPSVANAQSTEEFRALLI